MQFFKQKETNMTPGLKLISLGGGRMATKNLTIYHCGDDIIAVDYGIGFPEGDDYGVDFLIPDMTYLLEHANNVRALFISHAHADHFGAVPYLLKKLNIPVYANKLTLGYLRRMLEEKENKELVGHVKFNLFESAYPEVVIGNFRVKAFDVNHSVPGSLGLVINTPEGTVVHMADFKIDQTPIIDKPFDMSVLNRLGEDGVLCLLSDCLGSLQQTPIPSEQTLNQTFPTLFSQLEGKQVFITTISSNVSRMYQIMDAAVKHGRRIVLVGRSIDQAVEIARQTGYLQFSDDHFVDIKKASDLPQGSVAYIVAGCFGQPGSALSRLSLGEHRDITLEEGSVVIYSAEPNPPGVDVDVDRVNSDLVLRGADILDRNTTEHLHISGHGHQQDLAQVALALKPRYFIPIGGNPHQMRGYKKLMGKIGLNGANVFELPEGGVVNFKNGTAQQGDTVEVKDLIVDGTIINPIVVKDREMLSTEGVLIAIVPVDSQTKKFIGKVDIVTRGFIYVKESKALMGMARDVVTKAVEKNAKNKEDWTQSKHKIENQLRKFLYKETGRDPLIIVHSIFI